MKINLIEPVNFDTDIDWWNENRKRLNIAINLFNDWQTKHRFDEFEKEVIKANVSLCRKFGEENSFSEWQFDILNEIEEFILDYEVYSENN